MFLDENLPAPKPGPRVEFWTPANKQPEPVILLSRRIRAHAIHFDKRTVPCRLELNEHGEVRVPCDYCDAGILPRRWRGYLHVLRVHAMAQVFLCLPPGTGNMLQETYGMGFDYRGRMAHVSRVGGSKNKPLVVGLDQYAPVRTELPEELDPAPYLETIFRLQRSLTTK